MTRKVVIEIGGGVGDDADSEVYSGNGLENFNI